jgi:hypothetical protein
MNLGPPDSAPSLAVDTTSSSPLLLPSSGVGYHLRGPGAAKVLRGAAAAVGVAAAVVAVVGSCSCCALALAQAHRQLAGI